MNNKQKRAKFRELVKQDRIRTARELADEREQPFLPLFNEWPDVQRRRKAAWSGGSHHELRAD